MPNVNQSLLDAYNALFSNTPYGAMLRQRVMAGLQQNVSTGGQKPAGRGTAGAAEQNDFNRPGPSGMGAKDPTAMGTVPGIGTPGAGTPGAVSPGRGMSTADRYDRGIPQPTGMRTNYGIGFNTGDASRWGKIASVPFGFFGSAAGYGLGGLVGAAMRTPQVAMPGYRMPSFTGGGFQGSNFGGFNPAQGPEYGVTFGYSGGGADDRGFGGGVGGGGSSGGGLGGGSGAEGPDPSSWA